MGVAYVFLKPIASIRRIVMADLRNVDLNLLVALDVLIEECNVTRAAKRLHLSQSSVSAQLARLRTLFADPLLMPAESGRGMTPTARALALAEPLHAALKDLEVVVRRKPSFDPKTDQRVFQIVASDNATVVLGMLVIRRLAACTGRNVRIAFRHFEAPRIHDQLERGEVDLAIGSDYAMLPAMKSRKLFDENFVLVQRKGHPRGRGKVDLDTYCELKHVLVSISGGSIRGYIDDQLAEMGRTRDVALSVQHFTLVPEILQNTDYVCALPSRLAKRYAGMLDAFELPFAVQGFTLHAVWHPRNQHDPAARWLRDLVSECAAEAGGVEKPATVAKPRRR